MNSSRSVGRRPKAASLSREAIVSAAVELLDEAGETGLTVRALAARLHTGPGSIYWHVGDRQGLLDLTCDAVLAGAAIGGPTAPGEAAGSPDEALAAIRSIGIGLFDALDAHPWAGVVLSRTSAVPSLLGALDRIGQLLAEVGTPREARFHSATALLNYVLGVAAQMSRNAEAVAARDGAQSQREWLEARSREWEAMGADRYPFLAEAAADFRDHDDREQFIAGLDLLLAGIAAASGSESEEGGARVS